MDNKKIDSNLYNEKSLNLLNIRELRDIGRKFGIPAPTMMKKHDLVDYILKVVYGEVEPPPRNSCGRPSSRDFDMNKFIDKINKNKDMTEMLKEASLSFESQGGLLFNVASHKDKDIKLNIEQRVVFKDEQNCYLRIRQFVESEQDIKIDKKLADKLKFENYDVVEIIKTDRAIKIVSINGKKVANFIKEFTLLNEKVMAGTRKVFHIRTKEKIDQSILEIANECNAQQIKMVTFGLEKIEGQNIDNFVLDEFETEKRYKQFMLFIEHCKNLIFENQDIVVVIQNMRLVEIILDSLDEDVSERAKINLNNSINDFVKLGNVLITFNKTIPLSY